MARGMTETEAMHDLYPTERDLAGWVDEGRALPSWCYTDRAFFEREQQRVLRRSWHYAAHTGQLADVGDQLPLWVAGVPLVLVNTGEGGVRGFVNICRHRAHQVVLEPRNRQLLRCLYHGWCYDLDGSLRRAPRSEFEADFEPADLGLLPVQTATWGPTIWVNVDADGPSFAEWTAGLPEVVRSNGVDVEAHIYAYELEWSIAVNWKVFLDNAIECYHCPTCHPELSRVIEMDPRLQELSTGGRFWSTHMIPFRRSDARDGVDPKRYYFHWIFPTTYFQYAGDGFDVGTVDVRGVDQIVFRHIIFAPADLDPADMAERRQRDEANPTISQDVAICERVQRAHQSGVAPPGRLLLGSEWLLLHYQRVLVEMMTDGA
jgi:phenylpropionate dioxygenase-like ring-hydroxylating dioxygenase large terminal subunit